MYKMCNLKYKRNTFEHLKIVDVCVLHSGYNNVMITMSRASSWSPRLIFNMLVFQCYLSWYIVLLSSVFGVYIPPCQSILKICYMSIETLLFYRENNDLDNMCILSNSKLSLFLLFIHMYLLFIITEKKDEEEKKCFRYFLSSTGSKFYMYQIWSKLIENWWNNLQITTSGLHYEKMGKYDNWCIDRSFCDKITKNGTIDCYHIKSTGLSSTHCQFKMAAKNPRWPPRNLVTFNFQHQTTAITRASSRSRCLFFYYYFFY